MTDSKFISYALVAAIAVLTFVLATSLMRLQPGVQSAFGSAPSGLPATVASSSAPTLTAGTAQGLFATSTACSSRVITTQAGYLELTFTDRLGQTPNGSFGVYQAASTTQVYDSGLYGCGLVKAVSNVTQVVTLVDVQ